MKKTKKICINVYQDCSTCSKIQFNETSLGEKESAICILTNEIVATETSVGIIYTDKDCMEWDFDKKLLEECDFFIESFNKEKETLYNE